MTVSERIPIRHVPTRRTGTIGSYDGDFFFERVTGAFVPGVTRSAGWPTRTRWYAVLHRFDHDGVHATSGSRCPGPGIRQGQQECLAHVRTLP